jgi:hypothetical protein
LIIGLIFSAVGVLMVFISRRQNRYSR